MHGEVISKGLQREANLQLLQIAGSATVDQIGVLRSQFRGLITGIPMVDLETGWLVPRLGRCQDF